MSNDNSSILLNFPVQITKKSCQLHYQRIDNIVCKNYPDDPTKATVSTLQESVGDIVGRYTLKLL